MIAGLQKRVTSGSEGLLRTAIRHGWLLGFIGTFLLAHQPSIEGQNSSSLWLLASDVNNRQAQFLSFDVESGSLTNQVPFPSNLPIISAQWSPDHTLIATIAGDSSEIPTPSRQGAAICVFDSSGTQQHCYPANISSLAPSGMPVPIAWSPDSRLIYSVEQPFGVIIIINIFDIFTSNIHTIWI